MITVYVWPPTGANLPIEGYLERLEGDAKGFERVFGHVSLSINKNNGIESYLSFWPVTASKVDDLRQFLKVPSMLMRSYEDDLKGMSPGSGRQFPARTIDIGGLNESKVEQYITSVRRDVNSRRKPYSLIFQNCSSVVAGALIAGADRGFIEDLKGKLSRLSEMSDFLSTFSVPTSAAVEKHLRSTNSLFSNMSAVGIQTPMSVADFAASLQ